MLLVIQLSPIYSSSPVIIVYTCYARATSLFSYTLIGLLSDDFGFAHPYIRCFILLINYSLKSYASRGPRVSLYLILVFLFLLYSYCFLILLKSLSVVIPSCVYLLSCVDAYIRYYSDVIYYSLNL